jgi:hypothetical protein
MRHCAPSPTVSAEEQKLLDGLMNDALVAKLRSSRRLWQALTVPADGRVTHGIKSAERRYLAMYRAIQEMCWLGLHIDTQFWVWTASCNFKWLDADESEKLQQNRAAFYKKYLECSKAETVRMGGGAQ